MNAVAELDPMTKPKGRPKKPSGEGTPVRIDSGLVSKARYLASQADKPLSDYLSELLRPAIEKAFKQAGKALLEDEPK